jgi:tetratricopeptide (TPR) repeat protein
MRGLGAVLLLAAASAAGPVDEGNRAFAERRWADAVRHYEEAQQDGFDPDVLFNLGTAYAKCGDVGRAVLSYERARLLAPRDAGVREALAVLRRASGLEEDLDRGWRDFHRRLTPDEWTWLGVAAGALLVTALLGRKRLSRAAMARFAGAALLVALPAATAITKHALDLGRAVAVASADVLVEPHGGAEGAGRLRPGQVARTIRSSEGFVLVTTEGGLKGWVARPAVEKVVP